MFTYHTNIRDTTLSDDELKASFCIVHGYGENSDIFLESGLQYALNGFDVHLIDLRGFGMTGGARMAGWKISDLHYDVAAMLKQVKPHLPLFIYGHSMGGLTVTSFLVNNHQLNIAGVVLSAPMLGFNEAINFDQTKQNLVKFLAPHAEVSIVNKYINIGICCESTHPNTFDLQRQNDIQRISLEQENDPLHVTWLDREFH